MLWRIKLGTPWRDIPEQYGAWRTCHDRLVRWERDGTWLRILQTLQALADQKDQIDWHGAAVDSTHIRAHRSATGARKHSAKTDARPSIDGEWLGHSRGGRTSKIHLCVDGQARLLSVVLSAGQASDGTYYLLPMLDAIRVPRIGTGRPRKHVPVLRVDRAYGAPKYRRLLRKRGTACVCPEREDARKWHLKRGSRGGRPPKFDAQTHKGRNVVERAVNRIKDFRAVATRYEKRGRNFLVVILVACIVMWL